jgi:hypothetical protein
VVDDRDVLVELATTAIVAPRVPPTPQRLADLEAKIRRAVAQGRSEAALRAYTADWTGSGEHGGPVVELGGVDPDGVVSAGLGVPEAGGTGLEALHR